MSVSDITNTITYSSTPTVTFERLMTVEAIYIHVAVLCHELTMNCEKPNVLIGSELVAHTAGIAC